MKFFLAGFFILAFGSIVHAAGALVVESPINSYGTPVTISISSNSLTKVPTTQTSGRLGIFIANPTPDASAVSGFMGNCTSTALASTIRPISLSTSSTSATYISMREDVCLWMIVDSPTFGTRVIHIQEVKQ